MNTGVRTCVFPSVQPGTLDREVVLPMALSCPTFNEYSLDIPSQTCPEAPRSWPPRWFWVPVSYRCDNITIAVSWFFLSAFWTWLLLCSPQVTMDMVWNELRPLARGEVLEQDSHSQGLEIQTHINFQAFL